MVASTMDSNLSRGLTKDELAFRKQESDLLKKMSASPVAGDDALKLLIENKKSERV
jgi:hypothetical protein